MKLLNFECNAKKLNRLLKLFYQFMSKWLYVNYLEGNL